MLGIAHNTETHVLSSYFMQSLLDSGVSFAKKCLRKSLVGVMASTKLLVPINLNNAQWALAIINCTKQAINYYDRLRFDPGTRLE